MNCRLLAVLALIDPALAQAQDRIKDVQAIYGLVFTDVSRSIASPAMVIGSPLAFAPFTFSVDQLERWDPTPHLIRMSDAVVRSLETRADHLALCEPVSDQACRGGVRGRVLRLSALSWSDSGTVAVIAQVTQARAERDNAVVTPRPLYYNYVLVHEATGWRILRAYRATPDPRTA